jgi:hypothetical protein
MGREVWAASKPQRAALGIIDAEDAGILRPVNIDIVLSEAVKGMGTD